MKYSRPKIFISSCLGFESCRYDGSVIHNDFVERLSEYVDILRTCPEMQIGLGSPREALRVVKRHNETTKLLSSLKGKDYTDIMTDFTSNYLESISSFEVDGFILKAKSPSCGAKGVKVYSDIGKASVMPFKASGFFGGRILDEYSNYPIESEMRLSNYNIRDRFYTSIFTLAEFRGIKKTKKMSDLVGFHAKNKYLLMSYGQLALKELGRLVANSEKKSLNDIHFEYENLLRTLLLKEPTLKSRINTLTHIYGYFKNDVNSEEKKYYFEVLDDYLKHKTTYNSVLTVLKGWTIRFNKEYLHQQTIFNPYPKELLIVLDSGKNI